MSKENGITSAHLNEASYRMDGGKNLWDNSKRDWVKGLPYDKDRWPSINSYQEYVKFVRNEKFKSETKSENTSLILGSAS